MKLKEILQRIDVWDEWRDAYNHYVPQFIEEAKNKVNYTDWTSAIFQEFFERARGQCVSSLQQGYFTNDEKDRIKENWDELSPYLKQIAESQEVPLWDIYKKIQSTLRKYTDINRKAATYRLIAGLQPNLLCTIVNEDSIKQLLSYLNKNGDPTENIPIHTGNWFKDSHAIFTFYKANSYIKDSSQLLTYPWQTIEYFKNDYDKERDMSEVTIDLDMIKELLEYKKQIILQGPPGTGKTRLAKEIAESFAIPSKNIDIQYFKEIVLALKSFKSRINENSIAIESVKDEMIYFKGTRSVPKYNFSVTELYDCYNTKDYLATNFVNYPQYAKRSLVWYVIDGFYTSIMDDQFKLIQFHPSYTYEDFVRGIVSVPNEDGEGVLFKTENKILAEFAEKANKNYLLSQDNNTDALQDKWLEDHFEEFKAEIEGNIAGGSLILSGTISVFKVENDCFRYGKDWGNSSRINFKDFKSLIKAVINERLNKDENLIPKEISVHAHYRFTYYLALLRMFFEKHNYTNLQDKITLKNYVLIIDEINRANLPSVLGELIYALEYRDEPVESMYEYEGKREIILPSNLYIIGTMNTADRSVGHIDYAIKRRFAFVDVLPSDQAIDDVVTDLDLNAKAKELYHQVAELFNEDKSKTVYLQSDFKAKDVQLGHSYFLVETEKQLELKLEFEIKPLLNEYVKDGILSEDALLEIVKL